MADIAPRDRSFTSQSDQQRNHDGPKPTVAIKDGKTLDFSSGKPVYKDDPAEKATIAKSVAEMDAAVGNVTFGPTSAPQNSAPVTPASK